MADLTGRNTMKLDCRYTDAALDRWPISTPLLSCSLPVQKRPQDATAFLRGLLPEGSHLQALASLGGITTTDIRGFLAAYGRDIAGALVIVEGDDPPDEDRWDVAPYTEDSLAAEVLGLDEDALGVRADSELSIAGLQSKLLLVDLGVDLGDRRWGRPIHGRPSTHILKVDPPRYPGLVYAEGQCLRLAQCIGLSDLDPVLVEIGGRPCLIVKRYDRTAGGLTRVHQEDACQALGIDSENQRRRAKYESSGGPTLGQIAALLSVHAQDPIGELDRLVRTVTFTHLIRNADAHGKNVSFLHDMEGGITLAPLYDTVPTGMWSTLRATAAMTVNRKSDFGRITLGDVADEASRWGYPSERALDIARDLAGAVLNELRDTITDRNLATLISAGAHRLLGE